ncbi:hypothetical protein O181_007983 [Austropuccinia psidii MF-1]|uniref:Uncharacterized protein n=1 Tax=Austropuccinia psidii MF-1 TaxID=1389203 RepID=A0A9Q3BNJ0_9BASI|nr:hypothetical protein [Austropuccinia psidii MF-1]
MLTEDISQIDIFQGRYGNQQRLESHQEVQIVRGTGSQDKGESGQNTGYRKEMEPERVNSESFRITRSRPTKFSSGFKPLIIQKLGGQE